MRTLSVIILAVVVLGCQMDVASQTAVHRTYNIGNGPRLLLVGDSRTSVFPQDLLQSFEVINAGVAGSTTPAWLVWTLPGQPVMLQRYDYAVVSLGINDVIFHPNLNASLVNLVTVVSRLKTVCDKVYITTVPSVRHGSAVPINKVQAYMETSMYLNAHIRASWSTHTDGVIDIASAMNDGNGLLGAAYSLDGIHYTREAFELVSEMYTSAIVE